MSQQGTTYLIVPEEEGDTDMGDIEYLLIKAFDGKKVESIANSQSNGVITSLTASTGKDMYLAVATASVFQDDTTSLLEAAGVSLVVNGTVVERGFVGGDNSLASSVNFKWRGFVTTGQVISINIDVLDFLAHPISATLICFEENTGDSPQIPSI